MSMLDRAAQFSPFAALTGYEDAIEEAGRLTDCRVELGDYTKAVLDQKQQRLSELVWRKPKITVTYFVPDERKSGGSYATITGNLTKIDSYERKIIMTDGIKISLNDIIDVESDIFSEL